MNNLLKVTLLSSTFVFFTGCLNQPSNPNEITGTYVSTLKYEQFDCKRLQIELDYVNKREGDLIVAQNSRVNSSGVQEFLFGFGKGDGVAAAELGNIRGEKTALEKTIRLKDCK